jgi:hypothetical protein
MYDPANPSEIPVTNPCTKQLHTIDTSADKILIDGREFHVVNAKPTVGQQIFGQ